MRERLSKKKYFYASLMITLLIIGFIGAFIVTDFTCRKIATGDLTPPFKVVEELDKSVLKLNTLGINKDVDISGFMNFWEIFAKLICLPV